MLTHIPGLCVGAHVGIPVVLGSEDAWCSMLVSPPSACGGYHFSLYLQGIDRSHSWVNSAYAPGGSKAVLRRAPPYCGADPRQVPSLPAPARVSPPPQHEHLPPSWLRPTNLGGLPGGGSGPPPAFVWSCGVGAVGNTESS